MDFARFMNEKYVESAVKDDLNISQSQWERALTNKQFGVYKKEFDKLNRIG